MAKNQLSVSSHFEVSEETFFETNCIVLGNVGSFGI